MPTRTSRKYNCSGFCIERCQPPLTFTALQTLKGRSDRKTSVIDGGITEYDRNSQILSGIPSLKSVVVDIIDQVQIVDLNPVPEPLQNRYLQDMRSIFRVIFEEKGAVCRLICCSFYFRISLNHCL